MSPAEHDAAQRRSPWPEVPAQAVRRQTGQVSGQEAARVAELHRLTDPDAPASAAVDELVCRAAEIAGVPMATLNLLDAERQCPVATRGFTGAPTPRADAMCSITLELGTFVHVPDARDDPRFAHSPWVDGRRGTVRFYASAPLTTTHGHVIGTLCVFDVEPHTLTGRQIAQLQQLAADVVASYEREPARAG